MHEGMNIAEDIENLFSKYITDGFLKIMICRFFVGQLLIGGRG